MAASDILSLKNPMGAKLICVLYCIAMVLIALGTLQGVVRGARIMMGPPAIMAPATADQNGAIPSPGPDATARPWRGDGPFRRGPRFGGPFRMRPPMLFGWMPPPPVAGALLIFLSLLRGLIALLIVRVLAEIGNAILALRPDGSRAL